jgi:hypothetical protein
MVDDPPSPTIVRHRVSSRVEPSQGVTLCPVYNPSVVKPSKRSWHRKLTATAQQVSTKPTASSYVWGGRVSPLPYLTFHLIYLLRLFSPLQWLKFVVRRRGTARPTTNLRPDFPSAFTEWYFITLFMASVVAYVSRGYLPPLPKPAHVIAVGVLCLLIVEPSVWIFYYLLLRGFLETRYTIFHPAEYLLTFPLVVALQLMLVALVPGHGVPSLLTDAIGNPQSNDLVGVTVSVVGLFYLGVAITVVLSSHPGIRTRSPQNLVIVGAGDVTVNRMLPALLSLGYDRNDIVVVTIDEATVREQAGISRQAARLEVVSPSHVLDTSLRERSPTIIASPTYAHFAQLLQLANSGIPFAIEKPITASCAEREILRSTPSLMDNGFATTRWRRRFLSRSSSNLYRSTPGSS